MAGLLPPCSVVAMVSSDAVHLIRSLLCVDADERPTAAEALQHVWLRTAPSTPLLTPRLLKRQLGRPDVATRASTLDADADFWP